MMSLRRLRRSAVYLLPLTVMIAALALYREQPQFLQTFQLKLFDLYQQIKPREYQPAPVKIIDLDDASLARIGQWPWPRNRLADMLIELFEAGAAVVAFDVVFAEPDRTSPNEVLPVWLGLPELNLRELPPEWREFSQAILQSVPDHDDIFAEVIAQTNVVLGITRSEGSTGRPPTVKAGFAVAGSDEPRDFVGGGDDGLTPNLPRLEEAAAGIGSFNFTPDADNIVRRVPLVIGIGDELIPSLAAEAVRVAQGARSYVIKTGGANLEWNFGEASGLNQVKIGRAEPVPVDRQGKMWVHYTRDVADRIIPAWRIFEDDFDPALVEGQILFFGTSAAGLKDLRTTPLKPDEAGVMVHAQVTAQMLLGHFLERPDWAFGVEFTFILALGLILVVVTPRVGALASAAIGTGAVALAVGVSWYLYAEQRLLLDPLYPAIVTLAVYITGSLLGYLQTEAEKRQVRGAFSQYLSPALVEQLAREPDLLKLGGELREMTFLFCDVRGFTSISEGFKGDPQGLTKLINRFLTPMTDAILARGGTIDKYMGDCIMAFWNAPLDDARHADHGCDAALAMFEELRKLNGQLVAEAEAEGRAPMPLNIGIGLNTGDCVVGNMGSQQRFDYSVLGDAVNLASRLEGQSKNYGVGVVIGDDTCRRANGYATIELDLIAVKGKREAAKIHALLGDDKMAHDSGFAELREKHARMLAAYRRQQWDEAEALIGECRALDGALDVLYDLYEERIEYYQENPPDPDWDGVFVATTK